MTSPNVETHFLEIICCAEAKQFCSKTSENKLKLPWEYAEKTQTYEILQEREKGFMFILLQALLQEISTIWEEISNLFKSI